MRHRNTPRSPRHRNGGDPFLEAFVAKLGLDPDLAAALGNRANGELFAHIVKHIIPEGLEAVRLPDEAQKFRDLPSRLVSPEGHNRLQNLITDTTTAIVDKRVGSHRELLALMGKDPSDFSSVRRAKAVTEYYNPNRGFPQSFEVTHPEHAHPELWDADAAMDSALSALWYASSNDVYGLGSREGNLLAEAVSHVIEVFMLVYGPEMGGQGEALVLRMVSNALIWLQNADGRPLPKDLDRLEYPNKGRLADIEQRMSAENHSRLMARLTYGPDERRAYGPSKKRQSNPAFTTGELQRMQREVDRLMFPDGLVERKPPKPTYQIEIRDGRQVLETAKFKTRKAAEAKFADAVAFSAQSDDLRFAGLSVYLCINGQDVEHFTQPAKPARKPAKSKRKANPYHGTPAPPNSLMAKGEFVGVVRVDELDRLKKSADAPLMCYVFISGQGYQVRKFKSREALRKAVTESGSVGPANEFPSYWKEMVPPVVSYRRGR